MTPIRTSTPRRFLVDENLPESLADQLRAAGHEAQHVYGAGLRGQPDDAVYEYAQEHGQTIVTSDVGLSNARQHPPPHNGIVLVRLPDTLSIQARLRIIMDALGVPGSCQVRDTSTSYIGHFAAAHSDVCPRCPTSRTAARFFSLWRAAFRARDF